MHAACMLRVKCMYAGLYMTRRRAAAMLRLQRLALTGCTLPHLDHALLPIPLESILERLAHLAHPVHAHTHHPHDLRGGQRCSSCF